MRPERLFCPACAGALPKEPILRAFPLEGAEAGRLTVASSLLYEKGFRHTLHRLKFQEERALAGPIGQMMAQTAQALGMPFDGVTWVPMSPKKLQRRGYNQSQLLARSVARELKLPSWGLLEQVKETQTQHQLTRVQRADNVRGVYRASGAALGKRLLLVDDIVTTGATLRSCAQALYRAGTGSVTGLCSASASIPPEES